MDEALGLSATLSQKRVMPAFMAYGCRWSMAGNNQRIVIERHEVPLNGPDDFRIRPAPQISPADASHEKGIARKQNIAIAGQMKCAASRGVSRRVEYSQLDAAAGDRAAVMDEMFDHAALWRRQP